MAGWERLGRLCAAGDKPAVGYLFTALIELRHCAFFDFFDIFDFFSNFLRIQRPREI
jgi:hypothetical protein